MLKLSKSKIISTIFFTFIAFLYLLPNISEKNIEWFSGKKINLGLDLRGGSHLLFDVDFENYLDDLSQNIADTIKKNLRDKKISYLSLSVKRNGIDLKLRNEQDISEVKNIIHSIDPNLTLSINELNISLGYDEYFLNQLQDRVIDQSISILRMRVDSSGTKEPIIQRQGSTHILLQLPGEQDPAELKRVTGQTAKLTFHLVDDTASTEQAMKGISPSGSIIMRGENESEILVVKKRPVLSGDLLTGAQAGFNKDSTPVVYFSFNSVGAKKFGDITANNRGKRLAIVLDNKIISAPSINEPIRGGDGVISGNFTLESANELALLLRAGALPAPLKIVEERSIGPNLGLDSIEAGKKAGIFGFIMVVIFMFLAYGIFGLFANITLILAIVYILAMLSLLQATLTLPGIAGIVLTIGMAVDANVLIYERIKEELRKGCSNLYAIKLGFDSAFATIMDSNITTLIAAFLLYSFGVGAIKGFAVTLTIGIIASMFTALVVTRLMIDMWMKFVKPKNLGL